MTTLRVVIFRGHLFPMCLKDIGVIKYSHYGSKEEVQGKTKRKGS